MTRRRTSAHPAELFIGLADASDADDPALEDELTRWADRLAPLDHGVEDALPDQLWAAIEARLEEVEALPGIRTVRPNDGLWEDIAPGIARKIVHQDTGGHGVSYFLRIEAGAVLPEHGHPGDEHCVVLEGELRVGDTIFGPGSFQYAARGHDHPSITAVTAAIVFIRAVG